MYVVEDEYHFIIKCPLYSECRITYLSEILEKFNLANTDVIMLLLMGEN